jgi:RNA polymerase sigma-70 factor (ECF subfamily)
MNDEFLVENLKQGSEKAFRQVVQQYQSMVINTSYGFVHNYEESEDIAQEVFIQVYKSIKGFRSDAKLSTWIYRITVNKCLNHLRKSKKSTFLERIESLLFDLPNETVAETSGNQPLAILENKERAEYLHNALNKLPESQKTAFTLSKYRGLPNKDLAEIMQTSVSAVEALLNRAKKNLQILLLDYYKNNL